MDINLMGYNWSADGCLQYLAKNGGLTRHNDGIIFELSEQTDINILRAEVARIAANKVPRYLFCANKAEAPNDSLILQTNEPPYIMAKVWQFAKDIPDGFINSMGLQVKIKGYRMYLRYYGCLDNTLPPPDQVLLALSNMADYFLLHKVKESPGAFRRYEEARPDKNRVEL